MRDKNKVPRGWRAGLCRLLRGHILTSMAAGRGKMKMEKRFARDELVFDGIIAKVHKVHLAMGDGQCIQRDYIHYPGAAIVLPVLADRSIVLIRNWRFAVEEHLYELPAGCLEEGEDPTVCATRELTEETGYTAGRLEKLGSFYTGPGISDEFIHAYLATGLTDGPQALERYEEITVEIRRDDEVRRMVADGTIRDAKTISTLALYWFRSDNT